MTFLYPQNKPLCIVILLQLNQFFENASLYYCDLVGHFFLNTNCDNNKLAVKNLYVKPQYSKVPKLINQKNWVTLSSQNLK